MPTPDNCFYAPSSKNYGVSFGRIAHAQWSFAVDGGAIATIIPSNNFLLPVGCVITGGAINVTTQCTSGGSATLSVGLTNPSSVTSLLGATAVASLTVGMQQCVVVPQTASGWLKTTATSQGQIAIATATMTAGVVEIYVFYYESGT